MLEPFVCMKSVTATTTDNSRIGNKVGKRERARVNVDEY